MKYSPTFAAFLVLALAAAAACQDFPQPAKSTEQHDWLKRFVGTWDLKSEAVMAEGQPPVETAVVLKSEMLGKFWLVNTMDGKAATAKFRGIQTIGYDDKKKKYVGTWIDSMTGFMWRYEGAVDDTGKKLVLETTGPDMTNPDKMKKYRDAYEFKSDNEMIVTSSVEGNDGKWITFNSGIGKRK